MKILLWMMGSLLISNVALAQVRQTIPNGAGGWNTYGR